MFQQSPEHHKSLRDETHTTLDAIETKAAKLELRRAARNRRIAGALTAAAFLATNVSFYAADVRANQEIQSSATIDVQVLNEALDPHNSDNALIFIAGFGMPDADNLATHIGQAVQPILDGQVWSVDYNNADLETTEIAKRIIDMAEIQHTTSISLIGYSAGGGIAMQVQEQVRENSELEIEALFLVSTPNGAKALRPARQDEAALVEQYSWIPGVAYSTPLRFIGEMAFRADRYSSGNAIERTNKFFETAKQVSHGLTTDKLPGTWLMFDQMLAIETANIKARVDKIGELPDEALRPTIIYLGTAEPGYDYMVDDKKSAIDIEGYADEAVVPFFTYPVAGAVHSRPDIATDAYVETLARAKDAIQGSIDTQHSLASYNKYTNAMKALEEEAALATKADLEADHSASIQRRLIASLLINSEKR